MKTKLTKSVPRASTDEDLIRDYAYHLYVQNGRIPGRDIDNWLEAKACLKANVPLHRTHARLHAYSDKGRN